MIPIVTELLRSGLSLLANGVLVKGKDWLKEKTGVDVDKGTLTAQDQAALRKFELEHEEELLKLRLEENKLDVELQKMYLADTASARDRETKMAESPHASWLNKNTGPMLAILAIFVTFGLFYKVTFGDLLNKDMVNKDILLYILGVLSAVVAQIFSYYFGSSTGSKSKSDEIGTLLKTLRKGDPS